MLTKAYRILFWTGYLSILVTTFIPISGSLNEFKLGPESLQIRLDHFLHIAVYFLICMYYLTGMMIELALFTNNPLKKFILLVLFLAIITELVQLWVPERAFNVFDLISNLAGVVVGMYIIKMVRRSKGAMVKSLII